MASPATVLHERREGVALLRLNRPQKHNAFNGEMSRAVVALLDEFEADDRVHAVMLTGSGKAFSAGADMTESLGTLQSGGPGNGMARAIRRVADFSKPIIAAVNGHALGGGAFLAIVCDIRLASPQASFRFPGAVYGLVVGGSQLPRIVGAARAKELIFTARTVDAEEAERIGLVNRVVPAEELEGVAWEMAASIARNSPEAVRWSKAVIDAATEVEEAVRLEVKANLELWGSPDHRERFRAATERLAGPAQAGESENTGS